MAGETFDIQVTGLRELGEMLRDLGPKMQTRVMKGAVATAAAVFRDEAVRLAPVYSGQVGKNHPPPGTLKKAIYMTRLVKLCNERVEVWMVNVRKGKRFQAHKSGGVTNNVDAYYAKWVEYGHYTRAPKGLAATKAGARKIIASGSQLVSGAHYVAPRPFMRPAFENKKAAAAQAMREYMATNIPILLSRNYRR